MAHLPSRADIVQTVEKERHVELLPGTEIMTDIGGVHFVHAHNAPNATVLVPQPTSNIHDPLVMFPSVPVWAQDLLTDISEELVSNVESCRHVHARFLRAVHQHYGSVDCSSDPDLCRSVSNFLVSSSAVGKSVVPVERTYENLTYHILIRRERVLSHLVMPTLSSFPAPMSLAGGQ
jgi:hypothetical protein